MPRGPVLTVAQTWSLAQAWYGNRLDPAYHGRTLEEIQALLAEQGLVGEFWQGGGEQSRIEDEGAGAQEEAAGYSGAAGEGGAAGYSGAEGQPAERHGLFGWLAKWRRGPG